MRPQTSLCPIIWISSVILFATGCAAPAASSTAEAPTALAIAATPVPPMVTLAPPTDTPVLPTATPIPPTVTPAPTDTAAPTETPMQLPTPTSSPTATTAPSPTATRRPPTATLRPKPTSTPLAPLVWSIRKTNPGVFTDVVQKLMGHIKGLALGVTNNYPNDLTFTFPGNESINGYVGLTGQRGGTTGQPFTIPANGGYMDTILQPGDYAWSASIPGTGQAQGSFSIQKGEEVGLRFGQ